MHLCSRERHRSDTWAALGDIWLETCPSFAEIGTVTELNKHPCNNKVASRYIRYGIILYFAHLV